MAFSSQLDQAGEQEMSEINMIPLVDVMLVLLIIFMITMPVMTHTVGIDLPHAQSQPSVTEPSTVAIGVNEQGEVFWGETRVDMAELERRLLDAAGQSPQPQLQVHGARTVAYEHVIMVMSAAQRAGLERLGFVTDPAP